MKTTTVILLARGVAVVSAGSHVRVHAEMGLYDIKRALVSLLRRLDRKDTIELAERLSEELR